MVDTNQRRGELAGAGLKSGARWLPQGSWLSMTPSFLLLRPRSPLRRGELITPGALAEAVRGPTPPGEDTGLGLGHTGERRPMRAPW